MAHQSPTTIISNYSIINQYLPVHFSWLTITTCVLPHDEGFSFKEAQYPRANYSGFWPLKTVNKLLSKNLRLSLIVILTAFSKSIGSFLVVTRCHIVLCVALNGSHILRSISGNKLLLINNLVIIHTAENK